MLAFAGKTFQIQNIIDDLESDADRLEVATQRLSLLSRATTQDSACEPDGVLVSHKSPGPTRTMLIPVRARLPAGTADFKRCVQTTARNNASLFPVLICKSGWTYNMKTPSFADADSVTYHIVHQVLLSGDIVSLACMARTQR